ncbi:Ca-activated chloride channel family protein [Hoeflea marina]|uniref:Ca-activated chloride channel family protein n=1 Tax=Hoeflea marina TaxID=274592 RepID=A0A317PDT6_9HYPH|nr:marine proteobacterial sortase target protein [Hoeflea marina]PWV97638.1 Ca-activated chloride channel family protein [Hoeflea marina]
MFDNNHAQRIAAAAERSFAWRLALAALTACMIMMVLLVSQTEAAETRLAGLVRPNDMNSGALLLPSKEPGFFVEAPRLKTDVVIDVSGPIARAKVTQRFENPTDGWVEGTYVFPLPEDSAVDTLKMQIGDRLIEGRIKPRAEARAIYEQAKASGQKAALLEQQRPNIFTNQVANIGPRQTVVIQIEYQQSVRQSGGAFSLRFPMVVAPRYNPAPIVQTVDFGPDRGFAVSDPVPDRDAITAPVLDPRENARINPVSLTVNLAAGFPLDTVETPFHRMTSETGADGSRTLRLATESVPADRDFEMVWKAQSGRTPDAGLFRETLDGQTYLMAFVTPPSVPADKPARREVIFIIDNSGSMAGESIRQARDSLALAIGRLGPEDRFNVIRFDDTYDTLFDAPVAASPGKREDAIAWVRGLQAEGGTEMLPALHEALTRQGPISAGSLRQVVFLTDGDIGNESQLFDEISRDRGEARVFTVGIGSAPNSFFMTRAAELGRGTFTHVGSEAQISERMTELFEKLENPAVTGLTASMNGTDIPGLAPDPLPDLYQGEPVVLTARLRSDAAAGPITLAGMLGDQPWRVELPLAKAAPATGIAKLWARRSIAGLEAGRNLAADPATVDREIERVALENHLVSRLTSLVAVEVQPSRPGAAPLGETRLPLNLPAGWDFDQVMGEPASASPGRDRAALPAQSRMAMADTRMIAAAPTAESAMAVAGLSTTVALPQTATGAERDILLGMMMILFALMALFTTRIWNSGVNDFFAAWNRDDEA